MKTHLVSLCLSVSSFFSWCAHSSVPGLMDLPTELQEDIFTQVIVARPDNVLPLLAIHPQLTPVIQESLRQLPYVSQVLMPREAWMQHTWQSVSEAEPLQLRPFVDFENALLTELLQQHEQKLCSSKDWKNHGMATLLAMYSFWSAVWYASYTSATASTESVTVSLARSAARTAASAAVLAAVRSAVALAALPVMSKLPRDSNIAIYTAARSLMDQEARRVSRHLAEGQLRQADVLGVSGDKMGKLAYQVAEIYAWSTYLNPQQGSMARAYEEARLYLDANPTLSEMEHWASAEAFERYLDRNFGRDSTLVARRGLEPGEHEYPRRYRCVQGLVENLRRIAAKVCELQEVGL